MTRLAIRITIVAGILAALVLAYLMFMESARMERQIAEDLRALGLQTPDNGLGALLAAHLKAGFSSPDKERQP